MLLYPSVKETQAKIRVWRSLVSRLNGVQEASSSNLDTRTKKAETTLVVSAFLFQCCNRTRGLLYHNSPQQSRAACIASSSNLDTRTKNTETALAVSVFLFSKPESNSRPLVSQLLPKAVGAQRRLLRVRISTLGPKSKNEPQMFWLLFGRNAMTTNSTILCL